MPVSPLVRGYEVVIGLETHAQLHTRSKAFSGAATAFGAAPNTQASAVDLALPGTLPVLNRAAVECAIRFGLAVGARIAPQSIFARKNYFYPDLPKGYQISQYETPVVQGGRVPFLLGEAHRTVMLTRAHLEEDAGKSLHEGAGALSHGLSGIDLNRAGTPLLEIVTEPDMRSAAEAVEYARALHTLVVWLGICDGNMQEGSFRCDANVSVRKPGGPLGTRREIKNLNSFRFMQQAIDFEVNWQIDRLEDGLGIEQATVLFNPDSGETRAMRTKEDAHDYRYFPDPDLPPLVIAPRVGRARQGRDAGVARRDGRALRARRRPAAYDAAMMTQSLAFARYLRGGARCVRAAQAGGELADGRVSQAPQATAQRHRQSARSAAADALHDLVDRHWQQVRSRTVAPGRCSTTCGPSTPVTHSLKAEGGQYSVTGSDAVLSLIRSRRGLEQMSDTGALEAIVDQVLAANSKSIDEFKAGKDKAFNALVGQVMKASQGKANPGQVNELLKKKLVR